MRLRRYKKNDCSIFISLMVSARQPVGKMLVLYKTGGNNKKLRRSRENYGKVTKALRKARADGVSSR